MKDIKKTLKLAGIISLVLNVLNISNLLIDIFFATEMVVFAIVTDSICVALTLFTGITYLCMLKKSKEEILRKKGLFLAITFINILNNLFVWIISLWVEITVSNLARIQYMKNMFNQRSGNESNSDINISEDDYEIKKETENLTEALKDIESLKNKNLVSEEEYNELRQNLINKFLNK